MAANPSADVHRPADLITFLLEMAGKILVGIISLFRYVRLKPQQFPVS